MGMAVTILPQALKAIAQETRVSAENCSLLHFFRGGERGHLSVLADERNSSFIDRYQLVQGTIRPLNVLEVPEGLHQWG